MGGTLHAPARCPPSSLHAAVLVTLMLVLIVTLQADSLARESGFPQRSRLARTGLHTTGAWTALKTTTRIFAQSGGAFPQLPRRHPHLVRRHQCRSRSTLYARMGGTLHAPARCPPSSLHAAVLVTLMLVLIVTLQADSLARESGFPQRSLLARTGLHTTGAWTALKMTTRIFAQSG